MTYGYISLYFIATLRLHGLFSFTLERFISPVLSAMVVLPVKTLQQMKVFGQVGCGLVREGVRGA